MARDQIDMTPIETRDELVAWLEAGCKPKAQFRVGTEHEKFAFTVDGHRPVPYAGPRSIRALLDGMHDLLGWEPIMEGDNIIGLFDVTGGGAISLEPGGQFELSGAPVETVHQTCLRADGASGAGARGGASRSGIGFLGLGMTPNWSRADMPMMPKGRYKIMTAYMPKVGTLGLDMMYRTCTVQANLDFSSEADMVKKLRVSLALQPVATALFANSPFTEGKPNGFLSFRSQIWRDTDNARAGMLPWAFEDGMGFERWVDYALDVPMYFIKRGDKYIDVSGKSFRDFFAGKLAELPGERPTISDWANHLSTIFPEVRLKRYLEMRGADGGPWRRLPSLTAFWVGLLYDDDALDACWDMVKDWSAEERQKLRDEVPRLGFRGRDRRPQRADAGAGDAAAGRARAWRAANISTATAATRRAICARSRRVSRAASRRRRNCWRNSTGLERLGRADFRGVCVLSSAVVPAKRASASSPAKAGDPVIAAVERCRHTDACVTGSPPSRGRRHQLLRRLRFRQVIERRHDVLGERVGQRRALVRVAHQPDAAARQFGETFRRGEHAHAGAQARLRQHRHRQPGEHGGGDRAGIRARIEHADTAGRSFPAARSRCAASCRSAGRAPAAAALR